MRARDRRPPARPSPCRNRRRSSDSPGSRRRSAPGSRARGPGSIPSFGAVRLCGNGRQSRRSRGNPTSASPTWLRCERCHLGTPRRVVNPGERRALRSPWRWHMYDFAIVALLALGTVKVVDFLADNVSPLRTWKSLVTFIAAVGVVVALDYSLFSGFGITVRNETLGVWITGFMVAGATVGWRAIFGYLTHDRATRDETLGEHRPLRRAA